MAPCPCSEAQGLQGSLSLLLEAVVGPTRGSLSFLGCDEAANCCCG